MTSPHRRDVSPGQQVERTPGAFPTTPRDAEPPNVISSQISLSQAVYERRSEYTTTRKTRIKVGTWNVASLNGTEKDIGGWFVDGKGVSESLVKLSIDGSRGSMSDGGEDIGEQEARSNKKASTIPKNDPGSLPGGEEVGLYALGLQEIVDVSSATEALRPYNDPHPARKWKRAVEDGLPASYVKVAEQQLIGLYLVIYASPSLAPTISSVSTTSVGTGLMGYMGNKGAVTARIVLGETTRIVFINCHLSAGVEKGSLDRRNWDAAQILSRTKFDPVYNAGIGTEEFTESIGDEDFAFWFGDLNYRLEGMSGEDVRRLLMLHTRNGYRPGQASKRKMEAEIARTEGMSARSSTEDDRSLSQTSNNTFNLHPVQTPDTLQSSEDLDASSDPASLKTTLSSLLPHDQLHQQMRKRIAFQDGWREGPIDFLPTYKYDVGSVAMFDSSEKKRGPSWCDRILFRTRRDKTEYDQKVQREVAARERDEEMKAHGMDDVNVNDESVLFDYDPETDGADDDYNTSADTEDREASPAGAGTEDKIYLEHYISHQRVLSSDHKPLDAIFSLIYDAVDPTLKAKVQQEVAWELDKAENEGRPVVTIVVDHPRGRHHLTPDLEGVDFGDVRFDSPKSRYLTIANTGRVPATVGFVDRSASSDHLGSIAPRWLRLNFDRPSDKTSDPEGHQLYTLEPGDTTNVELTLRIADIELVRNLNDGVENLDEVLVLRIHNGRDYFIPLHGKWLRSAFGHSIDKLIRIPEGGVRHLQHQHPEGNGDSENVKWSAPREVFRLTEAIENLVERAVAEWEMKASPDDGVEDLHPPWEHAGWPFVISLGETQERRLLNENVREALDLEKPILEAFPPELGSQGKVEAVAETLVGFLKSLTDGVVTETQWTEIESGLIEREKSRSFLEPEDMRIWILDNLSSSPAHMSAFTFLTTMIARVAAEVSSDQSTSATSAHVQCPTRKDVNGALATIFADAVFKAPLQGSGKERKATTSRRKEVIEAFL